MKISEVAEFKKEALMKERPGNFRGRSVIDFKKSFNMTDKEVAVFVENPEVGKYFESVIKGNAAIAKLAMNYILTDYLGLSKRIIWISNRLSQRSSGDFQKSLL
jgi:Asp-tRNA(Asn)/Glu-tRNA(Gln) amidotransferase B subunit